MDRKCKCGSLINHLHGNRKTCFKCEPKKIKRTKPEPMITLTLSEFSKLRKDAEAYRRIKK